MSRSKGAELLQRNFQFLSVLSFTVVILASWETVL